MLHSYRTRATPRPRAGKWCHKLVWRGTVLTSKPPRSNKLIPSPQNASESVSAICSSRERSEISWGKAADPLRVIPLQPRWRLGFHPQPQTRLSSSMTRAQGMGSKRRGSRSRKAGREGTGLTTANHTRKTPSLSAVRGSSGCRIQTGRYSRCVRSTSGKSYSGTRSSRVLVSRRYAT
jgi:hypothetical protein